MWEMVVKGQRFSAEQIVNKFRQAEVLLAQGQSVAQLSKTLAISEQTYYRWQLPPTRRTNIACDTKPGGKVRTLPSSRFDAIAEVTLMVDRSRRPKLRDHITTDSRTRHARLP
jgi:hypothetical protein